MAPPQRGAQVALRNVTPNILEGGVEHTQLEEDLKKMWCEWLLEQPWGLKHKEIVRELLEPEHPNVFDKTIRDRPQALSSGHRRIGGRSTDFRKVERVWRTGPTSTWTVSLPTLWTPRTIIRSRIAGKPGIVECWNFLYLSFMQISQPG